MVLAEPSSSRKSSLEENYATLTEMGSMVLTKRSFPLTTEDDTQRGSVLDQQTVFVFPGRQFDPNCVRLVTHGRDPGTGMACLLGFFKLVCEGGYEQVLHASDYEGIYLNEVHLSSTLVQRQLRALRADCKPAATMDDFYVLLTVLLCNLPRVHGSNLSRDWFQNRVNDLVELFPGVSEHPPVPLYGKKLADAISNFGEQWPLTRATLCHVLLTGDFEGPMQKVQEYVSVGWRFAGMKHVQLIMDFLGGRNSWVLDVIPELRAKNDRLMDFLMAYKELGWAAPYMRLLDLPEAATATRQHLGLHVAAAYAIAVLEDKNWLQYRGVPRDEAEEVVLKKVSDLKLMGLGASPRDGPAHAAVVPGDDDDVSAAGEPAATASATVP